MTNDAKDRHVLAAAAHAGAGMIVTYNLRHFPPNATWPWGVDAVGPSAFFKGLYAADPDSVIEVIKQQASDIHRDFAQMLRVLHAAVPAFVELVCRDTRISL